jgi:hypothetical protein
MFIVIRIYNFEAVMTMMIIREDYDNCTDGNHCDHLDHCDDGVVIK